MTLEERMKNGSLYIEFGNKGQENKDYEALTEKQRKNCKELIFDYNNTRPKDVKRKDEILDELLKEKGKDVWIEAPLFMAYGCNTCVGDRFYANFNLTVVDDGEVRIGNNVMIAPNVTITSTGHPVDADMRRPGTQFSIPVIIGDDVWIGSNVVIMPGVHIGNRAVIGAGSVVTRDIPENVIAFGNPCRVIRTIGEHDREYYYKDRTFDPELLELLEK